MKVSSEKFVQKAFDLIGNPYLWGGNGETLGDVIRKYADSKGQSKEATEDMIAFINQHYCIKCDEIHLQDCSGFIIEILRLLDVIPDTYDTTAQGLYEQCKKITKPCKGALAFYWNGEKHNHVGICASETTVIHCLSTKTGVIVEDIAKRKDKWVDFAFPYKWVDPDIDDKADYDTITLAKDVYVYRTADDANENNIAKGTLYKHGTYYVYKTFKGKYTNITRTIGVAGGWIRNDILQEAEEW